MQLTGIHHLTAISADAPGNLRFYTNVLGLRLVKKTVNQDDVSAYHLFYADGRGSPGTDITFFDWPAPPERRGTNSIVRTGMRVKGASLPWWEERLTKAAVKHEGIAERDGRMALDFEDPEGQRLRLADDEGAPAGQVWEKSPVPPEHQIHGLGPITISVRDLGPTEAVLTQVMNMRKVRDFQHPSSPKDRVHVFEMGPGGSAAELQVAVQPDAPPAQQGAGGVHHVAFRVPTFEEYDAWAERLVKMRVPNSGKIDRFWFRSLYFREPNGVLFELATDGPGFATDEPLDKLGESLVLPPFLEGKRREIEAGLQPL
jgi:glyoxalase family protein